MACATHTMGTRWEVGQELKGESWMMLLKLWKEESWFWFREPWEHLRSVIWWLKQLRKCLGEASFIGTKQREIIPREVASCLNLRWAGWKKYSDLKWGLTCRTGQTLSTYPGRTTSFLKDTFTKLRWMAWDIWESYNGGWIPMAASECMVLTIPAPTFINL